MLIPRIKRERKVEEIISATKEKIYEEVLTCDDLECLEKNLSRCIKQYTNDTKTAGEFLNDLKRVFDDYNVSQDSTILTTALVYLFELLNL